MAYSRVIPSMSRHATPYDVYCYRHEGTYIRWLPGHHEEGEEIGLGCNTCGSVEGHEVRAELHGLLNSVVL